VGFEVGCSASTLHRFETGEKGISTETLIGLLRWFGGNTAEPAHLESIEDLAEGA